MFLIRELNFANFANRKLQFYDGIIIKNLT